MTPKEKAVELVYKFLRYCTDECTDLYTGNLSIYKLRNAKQCALIAVDEIMYINLMEQPQHNVLYNNHKNEYWQQVKTEIESL